MYEAPASSPVIDFGRATTKNAAPDPAPAMPKAKKASKQQQRLEALEHSNSGSFNPQREQEEELLVVQSIFMDEFEVLADRLSANGIKERCVALRLMPHPNGNEENHCEVSLTVQLPPTYPIALPKYAIKPTKGLHEGPVLDELRKALDAVVADQAGHPQLCGLAECAREWLEAHNHPPEKEASLHDQMQSMQKAQDEMAGGGIAHASAAGPPLQLHQQHHQLSPLLEAAGGSVEMPDISEVEEWIEAKARRSRQHAGGRGKQRSGKGGGGGGGKGGAAGSAIRDGGGGGGGAGSADDSLSEGEEADMSPPGKREQAVARKAGGDGGGGTSISATPPPAAPLPMPRTRNPTTPERGPTKPAGSCAPSDAPQRRSTAASQGPSTQRSAAPDAEEVEPPKLPQRQTSGGALGSAVRGARRIGKGLVTMLSKSASGGGGRSYSGGGGDGGGGVATVSAIAGGGTGGAGSFAGIGAGGATSGGAAGGLSRGGSSVSLELDEDESGTSMTSASEFSGPLAVHNRFALLGDAGSRGHDGLSASGGSAVRLGDDGHVGGGGGGGGGGSGRFAGDFVRIATLGKGGYGRVWRVRNKLDGVEYAVKSIKINPRQDVSKLLREVNTLSRMHHEHIVRYYQAWIEEGEQAPSRAGAARTSRTAQQQQQQRQTVAAPATAMALTVKTGAATAAAATKVEEAAKASAMPGASAAAKAHVSPASARVDAAQFGGAFNYGGMQLGGGLMMMGPGDALNFDLFERSDGDDDDEGSWGSVTDEEAESEEGGVDEEDEEDEDEDEEETTEAGGSEAQGDATSVQASTTSADETLQSSSSRQAVSSSATSKAVVAAAPVTVSADGAAREEDEEDSSWLHRGAPPLVTTAAAMAKPLSTSSFRQRQQLRGRRRTLYIQMEYCKRTLADVLAEGALPEEQVWRILRQLLGGLQYLHAQGMIHRDLKPKNVFVDFFENIKIGDFGLATGDLASGALSANAGAAGGGGPQSSSVGTAADPAAAAVAVVGADGGGGAGGDKGVGAAGTLGGGGRASEDFLSSHTQDVGTYVYMDPQWHGRHTTAFDMYALGIILLELCSFFPTGMERIMALADLRRGVLPEGFEAAWPAQSKLIRWMMHADPDKRPNCKEILESSLLPPRLEDEAVRDAMRVVSQPHSHFFSELMDNFFEPSRTFLPLGVPHDRLTSRLLRHPPQVMRTIHELQEAIGVVFRRHAAVPLYLPPLALKQAPHVPRADASEDPAFFLDRSGALVSLHTAGRAPLIPYLLASPPLTTFKRHSFSHALKHNPSPGGGLPREQLVADFDIVLPIGSAATPSASATAAANAAATPSASASSGDGGVSSTHAAVVGELLRAAHDILVGQQIPIGADVQGGAVFQICHPSLSAALLSICGAPPPKGHARQPLIAALSKASPKLQVEGASFDWHAFASRLTQREICSAACASKLEKILVHAAWRLPSLPKLWTLVREKGPAHEAPAALAAINEIESTILAAEALGVPSHAFAVAPTIHLPPEEFPSGVQVQVVIANHGVLARLGRWDGLCASHGLGERVCGGLSLFLNKLVGAVQALRTPDPSYGGGGGGGGGGGRGGGAVDVIVCSDGEGMELERLQLVGELWKEGIKADVYRGDEADLASQMRLAELSGAPHVLTLRRAADEAAAAAGAAGAGSDGSAAGGMRASLRVLRRGQLRREEPFENWSNYAELVKELAKEPSFKEHHPRDKPKGQRPNTVSADKALEGMLAYGIPRKKAEAILGIEVEEKKRAT